MKYDVTYACGHSGTVELFGRTADRERRLKWLEGCECRACQEQHNRAEAVGLPELTGTAKQVSWALDVRSRLLNGFTGFRKELERNRASYGDRYGEAVRIVDRVETRVRNQTDARWWIENRKNCCERFVSEYVRAHRC